MQAWPVSRRVSKTVDDDAELMAAIEVVNPDQAEVSTRLPR